MKTYQYIHDLYYKFLANQISSYELQELFECLDDPHDEQLLKQLIQNTFSDPHATDYNQEVELLMDDVKHRLRAKLQPAPKKRSYRKLYVATAAAVALVTIGITFYFQIQRSSTQIQDTSITRLHPDIQPGGNKAVLTLSNGKRIQLDDSRTARYTEAGVTIRQDKDGSIAYAIQESQDVHTPGINAVEVPKGGQYKVTLPDGTKVWLNAASSLRYPTQFIGDLREVELTGEGYFDVTADKSMPFVVKSRGQFVKVLGTEFNINAYENEALVSTTLIEGKVHVSRAANRGDVRELHPGQQAVMSSGRIDIKNVNVSYYTGWKDGKFIVNREKLTVVLRQIERWYDVSFEYDKNIPDVPLWGTLSRGVLLSELLQALEANTGYHFRQEGRKVIMSQ
ncbi:FecR family protein [Sphingobacterium sp. SYP-B4668]|uniref:FecR family protein n=1 Tax=Sphingobacterium sp. SYP-B4668 TaxID=2996035 RepID=UPI0022DDEB48|nr:FecR family protein [Sphingobacterium sp. SYP-B4668]